jgi:hypothetical protein
LQHQPIQQLRLWTWSVDNMEAEAAEEEVVEVAEEEVEEEGEYPPN